MVDQVSLSLLTRTRLSEKQARAYLALLQLGQASVSRIAEEAGLKRPITYVILEELVSLGYVQPVPESTKKRLFTAADPNALAGELEQTAHDFKDMLPYLRSLQRKAGKPYVRYYSGGEGARQAFGQIRRPKEVRYALSIAEASRFIPEEVKRWRETYRLGKARPGGRHLLADTAADRSYGTEIAATQLVRYLPPGKELGMDLVLADDVVFLTTFDEMIHITVIDSRKLYQSLCLLYDLAWEQAVEG